MSNAVYDRWMELVGQSPGEASDPSDLAGYFNYFRPKGEGVEAVFEGVTGGQEILQRLRGVYQATESSYQPGDWYFIVRNAPPLREDQAIAMVKAHLDKMREVALAGGNDEIAELLKSVPIRSGEGPIPEISEDSPDAAIYNAEADFMLELDPQESDAELLREAFYTIAADYYLSDYLLWPLYAQATKIREPLQPYFTMWKNAVQFRFQGDGVAVYFTRG